MPHERGVRRAKMTVDRRRSRGTMPAMANALTTSPVAIRLPSDGIAGFCDRFGVAEFALFGSVLHPESFDHDSDVDVMLTFKPGHGFTFENTPEIEDALRAIFGRPVDVIERGRIRNPIRWRAILDDHWVVYAA